MDSARAAVHCVAFHRKVNMGAAAAAFDVGKGEGSSGDNRRNALKLIESLQ